MNIHVSKITSLKGTKGAPPRLCKLITRDDGKLKSIPGANLIKGKVEKVTVTSLQALGELFDSLGTDQALAYGVTAQDALILSRAELERTQVPGAITRTNDHFKFGDGAGVLFLDYDPPKDTPPLSPRELVDTIRAAVPELGAVELLWRPSSSSCILDAVTGEQLTGIKGQHLYCIVQRASDIPDMLKTIEARLWLAGFGRVDLSKAGTELYRTPIDASVAQPERLDFTRAACGPGLVQRMAPSRVFLSVADDLMGGAPDLFAAPVLLGQIKSLTAAELASVTTIKADAATAPDIVQRAAEAKHAHRLELARERAKPGDDVEALALEIGEQLDGGILPADLMIYLQDGTTFSVGEILEDLESFHGKKCADPLDPGYGDGKTVGLILTERYPPCVTTLANGKAGKVPYYLSDWRADVLAMFSVLPDQVAEQRRLYQIAENKRIGEGATTVPKAESITLTDAISWLVFVADGSSVADLRAPHFGLALADMANAFAGSKAKIPQAPKKNAKGEIVSRPDIERPVIATWLQSPHRKTVVTRTFKAGGGLYLPAPDGKPALNSWRPFDRSLISADHAADGVGLFIGHIEFLFPNVIDRERFLDWLAHIEQRPGDLPHTAWLHIARNVGMGRNWMSSVLTRVWAGGVAANLDLMHMFKSGFNGELSRKVLAVVDEIREGGREAQWDHSDTMKSLITAETRSINPKYSRVSTEFNSCRFLMFSNHLSAIPLDEKDRRIEVVVNESQPKPPEYYSRLYAALKNPRFIAAVAGYLGQRDIAGFNPGAHARKSEAKKAVARASQSVVGEWCQLLVDHWPVDVITSRDIFRALSGETFAGALTAAHRRTLEDFGIEPFGRAVKIEGAPCRVSILRNKHLWLDADGRRINAEILRADSNLARRNPQDYLMERATGETPEPVVSVENLF